MTKMKVHELAKILGMNNESLLAILKRKNIKAVNHMSDLSEEDVAAILQEARRSSQAARKTAVKTDAAKADSAQTKSVKPDMTKTAVSKPTQKAAEADVTKEKTETAKAGEKAQDAAGTDGVKKNLVHVFRPHNAKSTAKRPAAGRVRRPAEEKPAAENEQKTEPVQTTSVVRNTETTKKAETEKPRVSAAELSKETAEAVKETEKAEKEAVKVETEAVKVETGAVKTETEAVKVETKAAAAAETEKKVSEPVEEKTSKTEPASDENRDNTKKERFPREKGDNQRRERFNKDGGDGQRRDRFNKDGGDGQRRDRFNRDGGDGQRRDRFNRDGGDGQRRDRFNKDGGDGQRRDRFNKDGGDGQKRDRFAKDGQDERNDRSRRSNDRKNDRSAMSAPMMEQQKTQRNKTKDKEKDYKKKELRDKEFENKGKKGKKSKQIAEVKKPEKKQEAVAEIKQIVIPEVLTIKELADKMKIATSVIIKKLFLQGKMVTVNQEVDYDTAEEIAMEFDVLCEKEEVVDVIEELLKEEEESEEMLEKRPPVVCVMGHVDHGKTSLLDAIRDSNVTDREAGGITQHIGASVVEVNGEKITFLDTPGHEAFTAMRMRGASSTDIAILVVAADDGVMPQTVEAINHAKAAGIEIIVAINKIDKPSANIERVKQEMTEYGLIAEDWGGSTIFVPVSAHTREGIQELLEMVLLTAEMLELKANPNRSARGLVIEAKLDKGKGSVATVLVQKGTLRIGDAIAAGSAHGKVRAMMDDRGRRVKEAGTSQPVEILGLNDVPNAGEVFVSCKTEKEARSFAETFIAQNKVKLLEETKSKMSLDDLFSQIKEGNLKELNIVVKADVQGSVEALKQSLLKLSNEEVVIKVIHGGVGAVNESDVSLASASNAIIIGFNVRPDASAKETADREGVDLRLYRVIYNAIEDVEAAMKGMLDPVFEEKILGHAEVRQTFKASGVGTIAGSYVLDGTFERNCSVRLTRDGVVIYDGALASLKRFKDDVKEVRAGYECGFVFENYNDIKEGDQVEAYKMVEIERK